MIKKMYLLTQRVEYHGHLRGVSSVPGMGDSLAVKVSYGV